MFRMIGVVIVLYAIATMMQDAFRAFEGAMVATFGAIETAATAARTEVELRQ